MNASPPRRLSSAHRYLFVLCLGLLIGLIATVMVGRALQARRDPFPGSLMQVMQRQSQLLQQAQLQNRCSLADSVPRLQVLRLLSNDLDQAFPGLKDSAQFQQHASQLRGNLNTALASPPRRLQGPRPAGGNTAGGLPRLPPGFPLSRIHPAAGQHAHGWRVVHVRKERIRPPCCTTQYHPTHPPSRPGDAP